ncbi:MAG: hypothetical protein WCE94_07580 [Candidatus Methanoperedens sp.]
MNLIKYIIAVPVGAALIGAPYYFTKESLTFLFAVWFMLIPVAFIAFLAYCITVYIRSLRQRVTMKPIEVIRILAGREIDKRS